MSSRTKDATGGSSRCADLPQRDILTPGNTDGTFCSGKAIWPGAVVPSLMTQRAALLTGPNKSHAEAKLMSAVRSEAEIQNKTKHH